MAVDKSGNCDNCGYHAVAKYLRCPECGEPTSEGYKTEGPIFDEEAKVDVNLIIAEFDALQKEWLAQIALWRSSFWLDATEVGSSFVRWQKRLKYISECVDERLQGGQSVYATKQKAYQRYLKEVPLELQQARQSLGNLHGATLRLIPDTEKRLGQWLRELQASNESWSISISQTINSGMPSNIWDLSEMHAYIGALEDVLAEIEVAKVSPEWQQIVVRAPTGTSNSLAAKVTRLGSAIEELNRNARLALNNAQNERNRRQLEIEKRKAFAQSIQDQHGRFDALIPIKTIHALLESWRLRYGQNDTSWQTIVPHWTVSYDRLLTAKHIVTWFEAAQQNDGARVLPDPLQSSLSPQLHGDVFNVLRQSEVRVHSHDAGLIELAEVVWIRGDARLLVRVSAGLATPARQNWRPLFFDLRSRQWLAAMDRTVGQVLQVVSNARIASAARGMFAAFLLTQDVAAANVSVDVRFESDGAGLSDDQRRAANLVELMAPVTLITGPGGTGKSHLVRALLPGDKNIMVAPTGLAALANGGFTVHKTFRLSGELKEAHQLEPLFAGQVEVLRRSERLVVDEVSMLRADVLDLVDARLRHARQSAAPFGGIPVIMVGDPYQLPPVLTSADRNIFHDHFGYESPHFFESKALRGLHERANSSWHVELTTQHRQSDDSGYAALLGRIRCGQWRSQDLTELNRRVVPTDSVSPTAVYLCTRNADADKINAEKLASLRGPSETFTASCDWPMRQRPADYVLELCRGAQVVFLKNDREGKWVNGDRGRVIRWSSDSIDVETDRGAVVSVFQERWELKEPYIDEESGELASRVIGWFQQYPLRLCWAISIHKSQGMTLRDVAFDIGAGSFAAGQTYVALSRVRRVEDLVLLRPIGRRDIITDPRVAHYMGHTH